MKRILTILAFLLPLTLLADKSVQEKYIDKYSALAVSEMKRTGVPASITLAQGLVESGAGQSTLAVKGNNHFGIKCARNWSGGKMYHDDDAKDECFRVYPTVEASYQNHSDFLRYQDRYKSLFDLDITDYKGWAKGLKKAGYATNPQYADKLIKTIEDYRLYRFDTMVSDEELPESPSEVETPLEISPEDAKAGVVVVEKKSRRAIAKAERAAQKAAEKAAERSGDNEEQKQPEVEVTVPEVTVPAPKTETIRIRESISVGLDRPIFYHNGVCFIKAIKGETYESIAQMKGLFLKEILFYNDLTFPQPLEPGETVYLEPKKKQAAKGVEKLIIGPDEHITLRDIAQKYAVRLSSIRKMNSIPLWDEPEEGDVIILRKQK